MSTKDGVWSWTVWDLLPGRNFASSFFVH